MKKKKIQSLELPKRLQHELAASPSVKDEPMPTRIKHSVNTGDLIASMGAMKRFYDATGRKVIISQFIDMLANYYQGATHPVKNSAGEHVCMNLKVFDMLKPLVESQSYVHSFEKYEGQKIDLDFDTIRGKTFVNLPNGAIQNWIVYAFPDLAFDISKPWITVEGKCPKRISDQVKGKVILNFTERYRNNVMDYFYLKSYSNDIVFAGTEKEHWNFCNQWQLDIPKLDDKNFLEYAYALRECRFFIGNQSSGWNLCQAMGIPRVLEICSFAPNCHNGIGHDSYGYYHQVGNEYYFRMLYNKTANK